LLTIPDSYQYMASVKISTKRNTLQLDCLNVEITELYLLCCCLLLQAYVEGEQCDTCQRGYFHLSESNSQGCLSCFCMGVTNHCTSSTQYRDKVHEYIVSYLVYIMLCNVVVVFCMRITVSQKFH